MFELIDGVIPEPIMLPLESEAVPTQVPDSGVDVGDAVLMGVDVGLTGVGDPPAQAVRAHTAAMAIDERSMRTP